MIEIIEWIFVIWTLSVMFGFTVIVDVIDEYYETEYETKSMVLFLLFPLIFLIRYRRNIIPRTINGLKILFGSLKDVLKMLKYKRGES